MKKRNWSKTSRHVSRKAAVLLCAAAFTFGYAKTTHADTWDGAVDGTWDTTTANWSGGTFTSGNDALFTGTPTNNVTTATGLTIGAITLDNTFTGSVTMSGGNTVNGATTISGGTLNLNNATGLGTSAITVNSGGILNLSAGIAANYANSVSGAGVANVTTQPSGDATLTGNWSGFTGTLNLNGSGNFKTRFTTTQANLISSSATINVNAGTTLYLNQALNYGANIHLFGAGNTENLGALRLEAAANQTGSVTLHANSFIGANGGAGTISGVIGETGGSFGITKQGNNTLSLTGTNTYSGTTTVTGTGTLQIGNGGTTGTLGSGAVTISSGTLAFNRSNDFTVSNNITSTAGTGTLNKLGAGKLTLSGTNTVGSNINASAGTLEITGTTTIDGGAANNQGFLTVAGNTSVTVSSGGSLEVKGTTGGTKPNSIVGQNAAGTSSVVVNGGSFTVGGNTGFVLGNNLNTATGVLTITSGTATITAGSAAIGNVQNFVAMGRDNANGIINLDGGTLATGRQFVRDGNGGGTAGAGTAIFNFNGGTLQAQANQTAGNGWFETATTGNFQVVTTTVKAGGARIDTNGFNTNINTVLAHDSALGATLDGGLTKRGAGTLSLGAANTYTGATRIEAGTLALGSNGSISGTLLLGQSGVSTGTLDVTAKASYSQADISGSGTIIIGTGKTVTATGNVAPGFSPGNLNVTGGFTLDGTAGLTMELAGNGGVAGTDFDFMAITEALTYGGALSIVSFGGYNINQAGTYDLFDFGSDAGGFASVSFGGSGLTETSLGSGIWTNSSTVTFTEATGILQVIPEPSTYGMLLGGFALLLGFRRSRHARLS